MPTGEARDLMMVDEGPHIDGESLYPRMGGDDPELPQTLRRITRIEVVGKLDGARRRDAAQTRPVRRHQLLDRHRGDGRPRLPTR